MTETSASGGTNCPLLKVYDTFGLYTITIFFYHVLAFFSPFLFDVFSFLPTFPLNTHTFRLDFSVNFIFQVSNIILIPLPPPYFFKSVSLCFDAFSPWHSLFFLTFPLDTVVPRSMEKRHSETSLKLP